MTMTHDIVHVCTCVLLSECAGGVWGRGVIDTIAPLRITYHIVTGSTFAYSLSLYSIQYTTDSI